MTPKEGETNKKTHDICKYYFITVNAGEKIFITKLSMEGNVDL